MSAGEPGDATGTTPVSAPPEGAAEGVVEGPVEGAVEGTGPGETAEPREPADTTPEPPAPTPEAAPAQQAAQPPAPTADPVPPSKAPRAPRVRAASIPDGLLTVEDHLERILRGIGPLEPYDQPIVESLGLAIHQDVVSPIDLPRFDNSAMDGYAVRAEDVAGASVEEPVVLPVVGEMHAGAARPFAISAGTAAKIMTGAPLPHGADAVVPFEDTDRGARQVTIRRAPSAGQSIRRTGGDVTAGQTVLPAGTVLTPREIGLLASIGVGRVQARPRPRVVIMSTGNELRSPGEHLEYDSIYDGNSYMLAAAVREAGAIAYRVGATGDDPREFRRVLSDQLVRADLVVTSGGISQGERDVVKQTLQALGTVTFSQVAMQPGKPQGFGTVLDEQTPIITLPGNGVSAYVSFEVFVLPAIRRMMGRTPYRRPMVHAVLGADLRSPSGRRQYVRGVFEVTHRGAKVTPVDGAGSHQVGSLAHANALIIVGEDETALNLGDTVRTLVLDRPF